MYQRRGFYLEFYILEEKVNHHMYSFQYIFISSKIK